LENVVSTCDAPNEAALSKSLLARLLRAALCLLLAVSTALVLAADDKSIHPLAFSAQHWTTADGLPSEKIQALIQGPDGYIWVGTEGGLARFDGVRFTPFAPPGAPELASVSVRGLLRGRDGSIWIGRDDGVVAQYKNGKIELYGAAAKSPAAVMIRGLAEDHAGTIWVGAGNGLFRVVGHALKREDVEVFEIFALHIDAQADLWIASADSGLYQMRGGQLITHHTKANGFPAEWVTSMGQSRDGTLWVGTSIGVMARDGMQWRLDAVPAHGSVRAVLIDNEDRVLVGSWAGLSQRQDDTFQSLVVPHGPTHDAINSLLQDRENNIWVGTRGRGLFMLRQTPVSMIHGASDDAFDVVDGLLEDNRGQVWIIPSEGPPRIVQEKTGAQIAVDKTFAPHSVWAIAQDIEQTIWLVADHQLFHYRGDRFQPEASTSALQKIRSIAAAKKGGIWLATAEQIFRLQTNELKPLPYDTQKFGEIDRIFSERADGSLLLSTKRGLVQYAAHGAALLWSNLPAQNEISSLFDDGNVIWLAIDTQGLLRLRDGQARLFDRRDGLPSEWIAQIIDDDFGRLWLGTHSGIVAIAKSALLAADEQAAQLPILHFTTQDGLASNYCDSSADPAVIRAKDGRLWFPTSAGIVLVDPVQIRTNPLPPNVVVEAVRENELPARLTAGAAADIVTLTLGPKLNRLEISYTALSMVAPERVRFRYQLQGFDRSWVDAGAGRTARYGRVPPGHYDFRVLAANSDGVWNRVGAAIRIRVMPAWHETTWFKIMAVLLPGVIGALLYAVRHRHNEKIHLQRQADLEIAVAQRTAALVHAQQDLEERKWQLEQANLRLENLSQTDSLTGLANRRAFDERLLSEYRRTARLGAPIALLLFDVDWFKEYNDKYGHLGGDFCLQRVAGLLVRICARASDFPARFGGDEFALVLPGTDAECALILANKLRAAMAAEEMIHEAAPTGRVTLSIGIATLANDPNNSANAPVDQAAVIAMLEAADRALYQAKQQGRDRVEL
jgi:diguanylate cyclase (GGDEF)-like protein